MDVLGLPRLTMHLRAMRVFMAVSRHGSTVRASQAIHLSQPAVARAIIELEKACGLALFTRAARGMAATSVGASLAMRVETVFAHLDRGAQEAIAAVPAEARRPAAAGRFSAVVAPAGLRALYAIAAAGSESAAAAMLGVTQPAIHAALQGLEQSLGARLFYRLASGTRLTPAGEALLRRVKLSMAEIRAIESDIAAWQGKVRGRIVLGVLPLSVSFFLPLGIEALISRHPDIEVRIVDGTYESLVQQLSNADVDAIVGALRDDAPAQEIRQFPLFDDDLVVVAREGHPCLRHPSLTLEALLRWEWVMPLSGTPAERVLEQVFRAEGLDLPAPRLRASSPALTLAFVLQTGRLALASRADVGASHHAGQLRIAPVALPSSRRRIGIATRSIGELSQGLSLLLQACQAAAPAGIRPPPSS